MALVVFRVESPTGAGVYPCAVTATGRKPNNNWASTTDKLGYVTNPANYNMAGVEITPDVYEMDFSAPGFDNSHLTATIGESGQIRHALPFAQGSNVLPPRPTREQVCKIQHHLAGLYYQTEEWGSFPAWFYGKLNEADRRSARQVHKDAGDTHICIGISEAYIEPTTLFPLELSYGYDYSYDLQKFYDTCREAICDGFFIDLPMAGDGMSKSDDPGQGDYNDPQGNTYGYQWLMKNARRIVEFLAGVDGQREDLTPWIVFRPGWDAIFYGWGVPGEVPDQQPDRVKKFGELMRQIKSDLYLAIEHTPGNIPTGEGSKDYEPGGLMQNYDSILSEYNTLHEDPFWQIVGRMVSPYHRPADQVGDTLTPPFYLHAGTPRGPYFYICFEPARPGAFQWVRGQCTRDQLNYEHTYAANCGCDTICF